MDSMSSDYLTTEKEEVKRIYDYIAQIEKAIRISMQKFRGRKLNCVSEGNK